jgi:hypothetical protein
MRQSQCVVLFSLLFLRLLQTRSIFDILQPVHAWNINLRHETYNFLKKDFTYFARKYIVMNCFLHYLTITLFGNNCMFEFFTILSIIILIKFCLSLNKYSMNRKFEIYLYIGFCHNNILYRFIFWLFALAIWRIFISPRFIQWGWT